MIFLDFGVQWVHMKNIIQFFVSQENSFYTAEVVGLPIVTQGKTFEELVTNMQEAVEVYFHDEDARDLGFSSRPSLLANFEIPVNA